MAQATQEAQEMTSALWINIDGERVLPEELFEVWREHKKLTEAATVKARAQRLLADLTAFLDDRTIPDAVRKEVDDVRKALRRTWADLESQATASEEPETEAAEAVAEMAELAESDMGMALDLIEASDTSKPTTLCYVDLAVIEPGWGNARDNRYYPREMVEQAAGAFQGAKMYWTEHKVDEKNVRNEVAQIVQCPVRFTETGAPVARAAVFHPDFAYSVRARKKAGVMDGLQCSIHAAGKVAPGFELDGRKGERVEAITEVRSVDWVTRAGAGGRALDTFEESEPAVDNNGGSSMAEDVEVREQEQVAESEVVEAEIHESESEPTETTEASAEVVETTTPEPLTALGIVKALTEAGLPARAMESLARRSYATADELQEAIADMQDVLAAATPKARAPKEERSSAFGITERAQQPQPQLSAEELQEQKEKAREAIDRRWGVIR